MFRSVGSRPPPLARMIDALMPTPTGLLDADTELPLESAYDTAVLAP